MIAQVPPPPPPPPVTGRIEAPRLLARGVAIEVAGSGAPPRARIVVERRRDGRWRPVGEARARSGGGWAATVRQRPPAPRIKLRARVAVANATPTRTVLVRTRTVTLAAVGDINLGDGVRAVMEVRGLRYPWTGVAPMLRAADVAFGNLECAVSTRGAPVPKEFNFRGRPAALRVARRFAGLDVVNLANNHAGDYGTTALLDTLRFVRRYGLVGVGAGRNAAAAFAPRYIERLGLRIAFVGISDVVPAGFAAGPGSPGTSFADMARMQASIRLARRRADVVVTTFHWGIERDHRPSGRQRAFAGAALAAGSDAVIGAHPHVLQPIERRGRRLVAYSLGNFVWSAGSAATAQTGILRLRLSSRGIEGSRFARARISDSRPALVR